MDNAQKAIIIGVGLFITIIIISVVLLITNLGTDTINDANSSVSNMSVALQNQLKMFYDNKVVTGADVKNLYMQYKDNNEVLLVIQTKKSKDYPMTSDCKVNVNNGTNIIYYDRNNVLNNPYTDQKMAKEKGYKIHGIGTLNMKSKLIKAEEVANISPRVQYRTQLILDKNADIVGIFCRLV